MTDKSGNAVINAMTGKMAHELFRGESESLIRISYKLNAERVLLSVNKRTVCTKKRTIISINSIFKMGVKVEVKEVDGKLLVLIHEISEIICEWQDSG